MRVTPKSFHKENNPCQSILTGVTCSKTGLLDHHHSFLSSTTKELITKTSREHKSVEEFYTLIYFNTIEKKSKCSFATFVKICTTT